MICVSTRGVAPAVPFRAAVLAGLSPDGGLYVPAAIERQPHRWWDELRGQDFQSVAIAMAKALIGDEFSTPELTTLLNDALNFPVPIVPLDNGLGVVELFHGPTFAFKDFGARTLARLMAHVHDASDPLTVLVATSGDTGSAVAQAFFRVEGTRVVVLYPEGQVSDIQEAQFTTLGENVRAVAVAGTFDDCQRLAKEAFANQALRRSVTLTSANSISLGRLVPQMFYYGYASLTAPAGSPVSISVPSGNFGNLVAGVMAWKMGAPIAGFSAPTTANDTVPRYLETGHFEPRPSVPTLANAMDVGNPSNFERLHGLFRGDRDAMRAVISSSSHSDDDVKRAIGELSSRFDYIADPHTAIAYLGAREGLFLSTAHPAKFRDTVESVTGTDVRLPEALALTLERPRFVERIEPALDGLVAILEG